jgi:BirA family biotin operon repressor/biotin-[acetyl-CoA-carboxylase] ligase
MYAFPDGYSFEILPQVDSTNLYAMQRVHAGLAANGHVFFAEEQTQGKGQRGKTWHAAPHESILMSIVLDSSKLSASQSFRLSATMALAAKQLVETLVPETVFIKWPNDIYIGDRKAGGILIENVMNGGTWRWAVVGIGLNINQSSFPAELPNAVSVKMACGQPHNCAGLAKQLCDFFEHQWQRLLAGEWATILEEYNSALYGRGQVRKLKWGSVTTPCLIKRVNEQGVLLAGEREEWRFEHGEVEWVDLGTGTPPPGPLP